MNENSFIHHRRQRITYSIQMTLFSVPVVAIVIVGVVACIFIYRVIVLFSVCFVLVLAVRLLMLHGPECTPFILRHTQIEGILMRF